jgi:uridine phosphorylase
MDSSQDRPPILAGKAYDEASVFQPASLIREARRQKGLPQTAMPEVCVLDPDGDLVRQLIEAGRAVKDPDWACYHTDLYRVETQGLEIGIVGCAVGAAFAVLVAEQLFASGCTLLLSLTSAGQLAASAKPPYFVLIAKALRDEGVSYHYLPPSTFAAADPAWLGLAANACTHLAIPVIEGATWTTDAPFRETEARIAELTARGLAAVEMEAAGLYAFAEAKACPVLCFAHVTNQMGQAGDFEKGEADGAVAALQVLTQVAHAVLQSEAFRNRQGGA